MLRIIAGTFARKALYQPPVGLTRPVSEKARGAIFNMLGDIVGGAKVLDIYAGSGALGLEALSRGAKCVDFVEKHSRVAKVIEQNIDCLGINDEVQIFTRTAEQFLRHIKAEYDVILMDPPYADFDLAIVERVGNLLQYGGTMVVSTSSKVEFAAPKGLEVVRQKVYGDSMITVLRKILT